MAEYKCYICRDGEAPVVGKCEGCGKVYGAPNIRKQEVVDIDAPKGFNPIPQSYRGVFWDKDIFLQQNLDSQGPRLERFANDLEALHGIFKRGKLPKKSFFIIAPRRKSKMTFAYSCMQLAYSAGYTVFPILDTQQMKRFLTLSVERPFGDYVKSIPYTYEEFLTADLLFLTVTKDYNRKGAWEIIDQVIDMRSRMDRVTIIISRYPYKDITGFDYTNRFEGFVGGPDIQSRRYPMFIQYIDKDMNVDL